jgi:multicomponent Na+:H+ antiporter subunit E
MSILAYLAMNVALMILWGMLSGTQTALGYMVAFIISFLLLSLVEREYWRRVTGAIGYAIWLVGQIALSGWQVTTALLRPGTEWTPGIVAVPLNSTRVIEITLLASSITLTPGTISVETGYDAEGQRVLFVHSLLLKDPDDLRRSVVDDMERRLLYFLRPLSALPAAQNRGGAADV